MAWQLLQLDTEADQADAMEEVLTEMGASAITFLDLADEAGEMIVEPAPGAAPLWSRLRMEAMFDEDSWSPDLAHQLQARFPSRKLQIQTRQLEDRVWEREWMQNFRVQSFGRLTVSPGWLADEHLPEPFLLLDPGLAFGTGTHETTRLCLRFLDGFDLQGQTVIDYGCGSGILALAAARLGAARVSATDLDARAMDATRQNCLRNQLQQLVQVLPEAELGKCDLLLANIHLNPLRQLAPRLISLLNPGGTLVLSGILESQTPALQQAYAQGVLFSGSSQEGDWVCLTGKRK